MQAEKKEHKNQTIIFTRERGVVDPESLTPFSLAKDPTSNHLLLTSLHCTKTLSHMLRKLLEEKSFSSSLSCVSFPLIDSISPHSRNSTGGFAKKESPPVLFAFEQYVSKTPKPF